MKTYVLHYSPHPDSKGESPSVDAFRSIDEIPQPFRKQFAWMLVHNSACTQCGSFTYQVRSTAESGRAP